MFRSLLLCALLGLTLAACGSEDDAGSAASTPGTTGSVATSAFPATVSHKYGTTTVESAPERIAVVGLTEQDVVLSLGQKPIATTEWYGEHPYAVWPWARKALGDAKPEVLSASDGFQFERIAALRPDLIIGTNSGMKRADYEKLSAIAPTIAPPKGEGDYFSPWDIQTQMIADAMGKHDEGERLIADVKDGFAKAAADHPQFAGKTATFAQNGFYSGLLYVYPEGVNTEFLTYLGFQMNPDVTALPHKASEQVTVSQEQLPVIDADVIVFATEEPKDVENFKKVPTFLTLDAVKEHRAVFTDGTLAGAIYFMTPLSLEYVLDHLTPQLADAVAGKAPRKIVD
jgi:iron complex transport system substrate-binding protein